MVHTSKNVAINEEYTTTLGYYIVKYVSDTFTLHGDIIEDGRVNNAGEMEIIAEYLSIMKSKTNCYWQQNKKKQIFILSTRTIFYTCLYV